jgi:hypothetical protein
MHILGQVEACTFQGRDTLVPPPVPPTLVDATTSLVNATADNTRFLWEVMVNQNNQQGGPWQNNQPRDTTYMETLRPDLLSLSKQKNL